MPSIVISLLPELLTDANLDLRYEIPDLLEARAPGEIESMGYEHGDDDALVMFLDVKDVERALAIVLALLDNDRLYGNHLALAATVGVSELPAAKEKTGWRIVSPAARAGELLRRD